MENQLYVGYARICITPRESVPLGGYGNSSARMSTNVLTDLYSTCLAFTDGENNTVLLFENDLLKAEQQYFNPIRQAIADAVELPVDHVMVASSHTHSSPDLASDEPSIARYWPYLQEQMVACARAAMADRKPAAMSIAESKTRDVSFVRHYVLEDGSYKGVNLRVLSDIPIAFHSTEPDPFMRLVKFTREGGKDVVLINWQCHPHRTGFGKTDISADIVGVLADEVAAAWDCECIYFSGASGNINPLSFDLKENHYPDYLSHGKALAEYALATKDSFVPVESGKVQILGQLSREPFNRPDTSRLDVAQDVFAYWERTNDYRAGMAYAESKGFNSQYQAELQIYKEELYQKGLRHIDVMMFAFSIGDVAFVTVPYEMFDTNGKYVRDFSPFKATIVATCANDSISYVPSAYGYLNGCYEADCTRLTPGSGERLAQQYVKMLEKLYPTR